MPISIDPSGAARLRHGLSCAAVVREYQRARTGAYGVDHVALAEGLGCKAIRVTDPRDAQAAFATARELMTSTAWWWSTILERVTNVAMGTEIDNIVEFEEVLDLPLDDVPANPDVMQRDRLVPV